MAKKLIKKLNEREIYAKVADYAIKDENGDKISDRKVKSVSVSGRTMTVANTDGNQEVPVVPVPTEVGLVLKSGETGEYGWGHGEVPGDGRLKVKLGSADAVDTGFSADVHSDVVMEIPVATCDADGLMSAADKTELDRISAGFDEKAERTELTEAVSEIDGRMDVIESSKQDVIADLADIRSGAAAGSTAYQKPNDGISKDDLASDVQVSLGKADTALQEHQDISGKADVATTLAGYGITDALITKANGGATVTLGDESLVLGTTTFQTIIDDIVAEPGEPLVASPDVTLVSSVSDTELLARRSYEDEYGKNISDTYATKDELIAVAGSSKDVTNQFEQLVSGGNFIFHAELTGNILVMHFDSNYNGVYTSEDLFKIKDTAPFRFKYKWSQYAVGFSDNNSSQPNDRIGTFTNGNGTDGAFSPQIVHFYAGSQVRFWEADISVIVTSV